MNVKQQASQNLINQIAWAMHRIDCAETEGTTPSNADRRFITAANRELVARGEGRV